MAMVGIDDSSLQVDSWLEFGGLVWRSAATWCCYIFVQKNWINSANTLPWWQHHKHYYC